MPDNDRNKRDAVGVAQLRAVLSAFSRHRPDIGYCQCLNYIGAVLLLVCEPDRAFWIMAAIVEWVVPEGYFNETLVGAVTDTRVLLNLVGRKLPSVLKHLRKLDARLDAACLQWFVCLFVTVLPIHLTIRVWDLLLVDGCHVLFWVALAILYLRKNDILKCKNEGELFEVMTTLGANLDDEAKLMEAIRKFRIPRVTIRQLQAHELKALSEKMGNLKKKGE
mmetsp:Transcript_26521/g.47007  ORF Transcript_26521/g.47007 Transcript_26521/m.47007 type:complete len:221 (-) Transcript_26521:235-897(-)